MASDSTEALAWVDELERDLGLRGGFFTSLLKEGDDWAFVIKLHTLVETAVAHLLASICGDRLLPVFSRLSLSSEVTGKIAFVKALDALGKEQRLFVRKLAEIRNLFAHDLHHVDTSLDAYVAGLTPRALQSLTAAIGPGQDPFPIVQPPVPALDFVRDNPRLCIWLRALDMLSLAYLRKDIAQLERERVEVRMQLLNRFLDRDHRAGAQATGSSDAPAPK